MNTCLFVFVACCVGNGVCNELITHSEQSLWVCLCLLVCDLEISTCREAQAQAELLCQKNPERLRAMLNEQ